MHDPDRLMSILVYHLNQIMKTHNWNQSQLAQNCYIGKNIINDLLRGRTQSLSFSSVERITDALGWPVAQILMEDNMMMIPKEGASIPDSRVPDEKSELYRHYCELFFLFPPGKVEYIVDFIDKMLSSEKKE